MFCPDCGQEVPDYAAVCNHCGRPFKPGLATSDRVLATQETVSSFAGKKIAAGVCGILLGSLGVHKFILGLTTPGVIMLLITVLTCGLGGIVTSVIGLIEGIVYLTKTDQDFYRTYAVEKKGWF